MSENYVQKKVGVHEENRGGRGEGNVYTLMFELIIGEFSSLVMLSGTGRVWSLETALGSQYCQVIVGTRAELPSWNEISPDNGNLGQAREKRERVVSTRLYL